TCKYAKKLMYNPIKLEKENLGSPINNASSNIKPVISGNKERMVYVSKKKFYDAIFMCTREPNGEWSEPHNIIPQLGVDNRIYPTSLSHDGQTLYLYRNEDFGGDIYVSKLIDDQWTEVEKLNRKINTKYWESHASITRDGKTLFFTSNRDGGYGGLDIYISQKNEDDEWGDPENCGPVINSKYDEHTPFPANNGTTLYFSSDGHLTMGGFDIFRSDKQGEKWTKPENLGYPINTTSDDVFFHPIEDRKTAIYSIFSKKEGFGQEDIYLIHFDSKQSTSWLINNK
ncbi:MAG: TolB family protein, partial [Bacteroidota bacterium]